MTVKDQNGNTVYDATQKELKERKQPLRVTITINRRCNSERIESSFMYGISRWSIGNDATQKELKGHEKTKTILHYRDN